MRRREFISLLGGAAAAWPLAARAQQPAMPMIGFLGSLSAPGTSRIARSAEDLSEIGYVGARNVMIEYRWAEGQIDRLPAMAADLVPSREFIAALAPPAALAAKTATTTIPIVFVVARDPVKAGLVTSLSRPGGNVTGVTLLSVRVSVPKRLELLREFIPNSGMIAVLTHPNSPDAREETHPAGGSEQRACNSMSLTAIEVIDEY